MNYQFFEDEFHCLESIRNQLALITGLLRSSSGDLKEVTCDSLYDFLNAQNERLETVLTASYSRYEHQYQAEREHGVMQCADWQHALNMVSGNGANTPMGAVQVITTKLFNAAQVAPDMQHVYAAWMAALARQSESSVQKSPVLDTAPRKPRKRDRVAAMA